MISGNFLIAILIMYYIRFFYNMSRKKNREGKVLHNKKLNDLRNIKMKTIEQQKEFIDLRYPKNNFKFSWSIVPGFLFQIAVMVLIYFIMYKIFAYIGFNINFWLAVAILFVVPITINIILRKFNLHNDDVVTMMR